MNPTFATTTCPHCGRSGVAMNSVQPGDTVGCPSCRMSYLHPSDSPEATVPPVKAPVNPLAIAALSLGLISATICWMPQYGLLAIPAGIATIALAVGGLIAAQADGQPGLRRATAGLCLGPMAVASAFFISREFAEAKVLVLDAARRAIPPVPPPEPPVFDLNPPLLQAMPPARQRLVPDPPPAPEPPPIEKLPLVEMGEPAILGNIEVRIIRVERGRVSLRLRNPVKNPKARATSNEEFLSVFVAVKNLDPDHKVDYTSLGDAAAHLDDPERRYDPVDFGRSATPQGRTDSATIHPGQMVGDQLVFRAPASRATDLVLEIPTEGAGGKRVAIRFNIPAKSIISRPVR